MSLIQSLLAAILQIKAEVLFLTELSLPGGWKMRPSSLRICHSCVHFMNKTLNVCDANWKYWNRKRKQVKKPGHSWCTRQQGVNVTLRAATPENVFLRQTSPTTNASWPTQTCLPEVCHKHKAEMQWDHTWRTESECIILSVCAQTDKSGVSSTMYFLTEGVNRVVSAANNIRYLFDAIYTVYEDRTGDYCLGDFTLVYHNRKYQMTCSQKTSSTTSKGTEYLLRKWLCETSKGTFEFSEHAILCLHTNLKISFVSTVLRNWLFPVSCWYLTVKPWDFLEKKESFTLIVHEKHLWPILLTWTPQVFILVSHVYWQNRLVLKHERSVLTSFFNLCRPAIALNTTIEVLHFVKKRELKWLI